MRKLKTIIKTFESENDPKRMVFDLIFYTMGIHIFYHYPPGIIVVALIIGIKHFKFRAYSQSNELRYSGAFIDLLNHLNSHLSIGISFEKALLNIAEENTLDAMQRITSPILMNAGSEALYAALYDAYPIGDCKLYCDLLQAGRKLGVKTDYITGKTLEVIAYKQQIRTEIQQIIYQKRLEQMILIFAPLCVILMVQNMSPDYLDVMYTTLNGRLVMTTAFGLIILMKFIGEKIVNLEV